MEFQRIIRARDLALSPRTVKIHASDLGTPLTREDVLPPRILQIITSLEKAAEEPTAEEPTDETQGSGVKQMLKRPGFFNAIRRALPI
jgi:hypothetical protein